MKVGIIAIGSYEESHGAALPPDTDAKIAEFISEEVSNQTNTEFLGTLDSAYELPEIDTGNHQSLEEVKEELREKLKDVKDRGFEGIVLVNAHGGNQPLEEHLGSIEEETGVKLDMDSTICKIEGPHAGSGELSVGSIVGITDESKIEEHANIDKYPEVGFAGFEEVRKKYDWAEEHAKEIRKKGVKVDRPLGKKLLESAVAGAVEKVLEMRSD